MDSFGVFIREHGADRLEDRDGHVVFARDEDELLFLTAHFAHQDSEHLRIASFHVIKVDGTPPIES
jgi:hypothetical protein